MQHFTQGFLQISFNNVWTTNEARRAEDIRQILRNSNSSDLAIPFTRLASLTKHPFIHLPKTWIKFKNENVKIFGIKLNLKFH